MNSQLSDLLLNVLSAHQAGDLLFGHCSQECLGAELCQNCCREALKTRLISPSLAQSYTGFGEWELKCADANPPILLYIKVVLYQINFLVMYMLQDKWTAIVFSCSTHHSHQSLCISVTEMRSFVLIECVSFPSSIYGLSLSN